MSTQKWSIDPTHSSIEFSVKHMMFTTVRGHFSEYDGNVSLDEDNASASSVKVTIDASSIDTGNEDRDEHLRSGDFFDAESYPTIEFESKSVSGPLKEGESFQVVGDLTIKDVTKEVTLDASFEGTGTDPWGGSRAGFSASAKIDRREFGLTWNQALETGGVLVGNDISISLQVQAVLEEELAAV